MRVVQVGLGGFGRDWAKNVIPRVPEVEVVATADLFAGSRERAVAAGLTTTESYYPTVEAAIEATDPEAVLVTASLVGHVPAAEVAPASGLHVLVEKPFAPSVAEAKRAGRPRRRPRADPGRQPELPLLPRRPGRAADRR